VQFAVFGTLEVRGADGQVVDLGGPQPRTVLAALLAANGRVVSVDALIDALWGEAPPKSAPGTLQTYVSRLRRALEPDRAPRDEPRVLVSDPQGYRLVVEPDAVDMARFEALADAGRDALSQGRAADAAVSLREAEALWKGDAFAEYAEAGFARGPATRLEERRLSVLEVRMEAELALGLHAEVAGEAAVAVRDQPLREARWSILALALYRSGRQAEALRALDEARRTLVEELGVEPGRALKELEAGILAQDPRLDLPEPTVAAALADGSDAAEVGDPSIVGRVAELGSLRTALGEARRATRFVVVEGEPGIGKTRLLEALGGEAAAGGAVVVWGRTHESGAAPAYWPWLAALRTLVEQRPDLASGLGSLLDPRGGLEEVGEAGPASFRLHEAVAVALETAGAASPVVVLLDDLQWADPASLELLGYLATRLSDAPVLVGVTLRSRELGRSDPVTSALSAIARRPGSRRLTLKGLDATDSGELLAQAAGRPVDESVAAAIHARASGNPFFAGELARLLADEDQLDDVGAVARTPVPEGVRDVVRRRLDRLPEPTVDVLRVAAVLGRDLELSLLAAAAGTSAGACLDALEPAVAQRLLVEAPDPAAPPGSPTPWSARSWSRT
jgi:DNA-binding SARP family transcriptional activator